MPDKPEIPAALEKTLNADFWVAGVGNVGIIDSVREDRARAMAAMARHCQRLVSDLHGTASLAAKLIGQDADALEKEATP